MILLLLCLRWYHRTTKDAKLDLISGSQESQLCRSVERARSSLKHPAAGSKQGILSRQDKGCLLGPDPLRQQAPQEIRNISGYNSHVQYAPVWGIRLLIQEAKQNMEPSEPDSDRRHRVRRGLCLQFTLLTPFGVFTLFSERTQCSISLYQYICLPICSSPIQEQPGHPVVRSLSSPVTVIPATWPDRAMSRYRSDFHNHEDDVSTTNDLSPSYPHSLPTRNSTDPTRSTEQAFEDLHESIKDDSFFTMGRFDVLHVLKRAFYKELGYLKWAYAAACPDPLDLNSSSPSELLFNKRIPEVDRTLTGILALRWLRNDDYVSFTQNQVTAMKLSRDSFGELRSLFDIGLNRYTDHQAIFTLIVMQMTNDLGKSSRLEDELQNRLPIGVRLSANHDMVMEQVLQCCDSLIPSFQRLPRQQKALVRKLIRLSAEFNPGQLVQAECPPAALNVLREFEIDPIELDMKFMELFLDVAGARGHVDHEGAATMTEPTFQGYMEARIQSLNVVEGRLQPEQAYERILQHRLRMLSNAGYRGDFDIRSPKVAAKARLFCMGRVADATTATLYDDVYEGLPPYIQDRLERGFSLYARPAVQPTYMPAMLSWVRGPSRGLREEQLAVLLIYLSRVLDLTEEALPHDVEIVERDVKGILESLVQSDAFRKDPYSIVSDDTELPYMEIAKRSMAPSRSPRL